MPVMNFDLDDGLPSVSFTLKYEDADRFIAFMQHCYDLEQTVDNLKRHSSEVEDERDALVAHVELLTRVAEKLSTVAPEYLDHLAADAHLVLRDAPATSLARVRGEVRHQVAEEWELGLPRLKAEWQAEALELLRDHLGPDQNTPQDDGFDAGWDAAFESIGKRAAELRRKAEEPSA